MALGKCVCCGEKIGYLSNHSSCMLGILCLDCTRKAERFPQSASTMSVEQVRELVSFGNSVDENVARLYEHDHIGRKFEYIAIFDDENEKVYLPHRVCTTIAEQGFWPFSFEDIKSAQLLQGESPIETYAATNALEMGLGFGLIGMLYGIAKGQENRTGIELKAKVEVRNYPRDSYTVMLLQAKANVDESIVARRLQYGTELVNRLNKIAGYVEPMVTAKDESCVSGRDAAEEIRKFMLVMDDGIISAEEFDAKKKQLLGL